MQQIFHLVYKSHTSDSFDKSKITEIVKKSQLNNKRSGLTGLLIYRQDTFIQLLEGDEKKVREVYAKIAKDPRHDGLEILIESKSSLRIVPEWSMNQVKENPEQASSQSLFELFNYVLNNNTRDKNLIMPLLEKFKSSL